VPHCLSAAPQWKVLAAAATLLCLAVAPPLLRAHGDALASLAIAAFFSRLCHQQAARSLLLFGTPVAVCARCLGIYAGATLGSLLRLKHPAALRLLGFAVALNAIDVAAESCGLHGNLPLMRLALGGALGLAAGAMLSAKEQAAPRLASRL
jgi:uncharacterized membrane protein